VSDSRVGEAHLEVYETATRRNASRRVRALPRAADGRVRVVAYTDATILGGAEESLATLLEGLDERFEPIVMGTSPSVVDWLQARRPSIGAVVVPPVAGKRDLPGELAHIDAIRRLRPDIFHANLRMPFACQYGIAGALAVPGVRVVVVEHSITRATDPLQRRAKRLTSRLVQAHVAVGDRLARTVEAEVGLSPGSIRTIHNGVADRRPLTEGDGLPRPLVGSVGRLSPEKGYDVLLNALAEADGFHLALVGSGPLRTELEELAASLGVSDRVTFTGWVKDSRAWIEAYDVFVLPSRSEGLPLTIIEAMLAERPVVATDVGGVPELLETGRTGVIVPSEDAPALATAITGLVTDPAGRERIGREARAAALEHFTPEAMRAGYEALYDELAGRRPGR
jgi:glycosyltransferase involved in cell wall biosynthesis